MGLRDKGKHAQHVFQDGSICGSLPEMALSPDMGLSHPHIVQTLFESSS